ncbi:MAG: hypothetical protein Q9165_000927 [Trypethelium subeluteriae]
MKRARSADDVDGDATALFPSKKQRLHLQLFTSRLSTPYAAPSSYIVGRGESKIAAWARQKGLGVESRGGDLRRVASINRIKKRVSDGNYAVVLKNSTEETSQGLPHTPSARIYSKPPFAIPPSPLGVSNYTALDDEDPFSEQDILEPDDEKKNEIYSDFNVLDPVERDPERAAEEEELHSVFARVPLEISYSQLQREQKMVVDVVGAVERPPSPPDLLREVLKEKEKQGEMSFMEL